MDRYNEDISAWLSGFTFPLINSSLVRPSKYSSLFFSIESVLGWTVIDWLGRSLTLLKRTPANHCSLRSLPNPVGNIAKISFGADFCSSFNIVIQSISFKSSDCFVDCCTFLMHCHYCLADCDYGTSCFFMNLNSLPLCPFNIFGKRARERTDLQRETGRGFKRSGWFYQATPIKRYTQNPIMYEFILTCTQ